MKAEFTIDVIARRAWRRATRRSARGAPGVDCFAEPAASAGVDCFASLAMTGSVAARNDKGR